MTIAYRSGIRVGLCTIVCVGVVKVPCCVGVGSLAARWDDSGSGSNLKRWTATGLSSQPRTAQMNSKALDSTEPDVKRTDKRKQSLYFPEEMLKEIQLEANRQDRSLSWIVQQAWRIARNEIMRFPSVNDVVGDETHGEE